MPAARTAPGSRTSKPVPPSVTIAVKRHSLDAKPLARLFEQADTFCQGWPVSLRSRKATADGPAEARRRAKAGGEGRNRPSLVFHKPLEINRLWHR